MNAKLLDATEHLRRTNSDAPFFPLTGLRTMTDYQIDEHRLEDGDVVTAWAFAITCVATIIALAALSFM